MSDKKQKSKFGDDFKLGLSTLISNEAVIQMARNRPWWGGVVGAILSVVIAVVPVMTSQFKVKGGDMLNAPTYSLEAGLVKFQEGLIENNVSMEINAEFDKMTVSNWESMVNYPERNSWNYSIEGTGTILEVFWSPLEGDSLIEYAQTVTENITHSFIFFSPKQFIFAKASYGTAPASSLGGLYDRIENNFDIKDFASKDSKGNLYEVNYQNATKDNYDKYLNSTLSSWQIFLTDAYQTNKIKSGWRWTGIMSGVYAGFIVFMGLLIFLMTRGKNNPYKIFTFFETQLMAYWAAFSPAVIGLLLGFVMKNMAMMGFIFAFGLRIMWLSMKSIRPQ